ncbi:uncharacterized protein LOC109602490 [Aethina tumida]|uniref:uncharacterized protein LOC109602490 n=1 Tax=Aethina tumida TaxID=116153 RepID=UPI0021483221|nr:uncharacterized protein LOC109602490 [Aethina tumida]
MVDLTMNKELLVALIILAGVVLGEVQSCNSCGKECQSACGTRHFRTCCFNYLKKRSSPPEPPLPFAMDPSLRLELWLAKSRYPYFQQRNAFEEALNEAQDVSDNDDRDTQIKI